MNLTPVSKCSAPPFVSPAASPLLLGGLFTDHKRQICYLPF